jgi:hypothetical protein
MDGNLEYLQTNLSGSNTIIGNTTIKTTADSDAVLEIFTTSSVVTQSSRGGETTTTTQTKGVRSDLSAIINTAPFTLPPTVINSEFTSSFNHINTVSVLSSSLGEFTNKTLGVSYLFASSSYDPTLGAFGDLPQIQKFIGYDGNGYLDNTSITPIDQDNIFSINVTTANSPINPAGFSPIDNQGSGSIVLRKNSDDLNVTTDTALYIAGTQPGVNVVSTDDQVLNVYGVTVASDPFSLDPSPTTYSTLFQVNQSGSISMPQTASAEPAWTGSDGEIVPATVGGVYYLYMWMNGAWRSGSFS